MAKEIGEEYASSLADLKINSKPLINMLTILAEENLAHAGVIVEVVEKHLEKVRAEVKLPVLYLVDSIIKNVGKEYTEKFSQNIVSMFTKTFKQVDEKTRAQMFKLRETWNDVFPSKKLYQLDVKVNMVDPAWPILAQIPQTNIHVNPNFIKKTPPITTVASSTTTTTPAVVVPLADPAAAEEDAMRKTVAMKEQELLLLKRQKIEMELEQTRRQLEENEKKLHKTAQLVASAPAVPTSVLPSVPVIAQPVPVKERLGPVVTSKPMNNAPKIAPVSSVMLNTTKRMDPRLARMPPKPDPSVIMDLFDVKPIERRKNAITIDVPPFQPKVDEPKRDNRRRRDPRLERSRRGPDLDRPHRELNSERTRRGPDLERPNRNQDTDRMLREPDFDRSRLEAKSKREDDSEAYVNKSPILKGKDIPAIPSLEPKKVKLPPIPKINRSKHKEKHEDDKHDNMSPIKRKREQTVSPMMDKKLKKKRDLERKTKHKTSPKQQEKSPEKTEFKKDEDTVPFKELKGNAKERNYIRRNKEKSDSPEKIVEETQMRDESNIEIDKVKNDTIAEVVLPNKDVDLRLLSKPIAEPVSRKRPSTETSDVKTKKKYEKFDVLFGDEDVDLRKLPTDVEVAIAPVIKDIEMNELSSVKSNEDVSSKTDETIECASSKSKLDLVRAKLAEATKGKDRLGRTLLFTNESKDKRKTSTSEDTDMRIQISEIDADNERESIKIIMSQAEEQYKVGNINKEQYNNLVMQVLQLNERQKLNEAKQRESLEASKRKLKKLTKGEPTSDDEVKSPEPEEKLDFHGDIDERIVPIAKLEPPSISMPPVFANSTKDSDLRVPPMPLMPGSNMPDLQLPFNGPAMPLVPPFMMGPKFGPFPPKWRAGGPRGQGFPPYMRPGFDPRLGGPLPPFPPGPVVNPGIAQGENPFKVYEWTETPPQMGSSASKHIPPTDFRYIEYIKNDPMKTIDIDSTQREIRFYDDTAVVMLDWDDPRDISFLAGKRRLTFDNKDSVVLNLNDDYKTVNIDDVDYSIKLGYPTRELFINGRWYECYFGGQPVTVAVDGKMHVLQLEGPPPQVNIGTKQRTDLVAGKINLIVDATSMFPIFLDSKPQIFEVNGVVLVLRFVDSLETVLINEKPFKVEFGGLPKPIFIGKNKHFIRFSVLPRNIKPGRLSIWNMEGKQPMKFPNMLIGDIDGDYGMGNGLSVTGDDSRDISNPDGENSNPGGLDMLASAMPTTMGSASIHGGYSASGNVSIPGLESAAPTPTPGLPNLNIDDLFAKLVASGIVKPTNNDLSSSETPKVPETKKQEEDKSVIKHVNLLKSETMRQRQPGVVAKLYGGMQCSGCGTRFPPEHTVRYSQHLDWHFRQNRRDRDSARRAHSRNWHYDLSDWVQYEEIEDLEEREKSWFENQSIEEGAPTSGITVTEHAESTVPASLAPSDQKCGVCGDLFDQYYDQDREEWHLRKAIRHNETNYHPSCYEDLKGSLQQEESKNEPSIDEDDEKLNEEPPKRTSILPETNEWSDSDVEFLDEPEDNIENIADSSNEVEKVPETKVDEEKQLEIEEDDEDDDDVVLKTEPVEEILVNDDDTDEETEELRRERDRNIPSPPDKPVRIKLEPVDPDDEPIITAEVEAINAPAHTTQTAVTSSLDGNVQLPAPTMSLPQGSHIRINITKPVHSPPTQTPSNNQQPPPPGEEEPELEPVFTYKESMQGKHFLKQPPVKIGNELSGLCSIM